MKEKIISTISDVVVALFSNEGSFDVASTQIILERPADMSHGDYSSNAALIFAPKLKKAPLVLAIEIVEKLKAELLEQKLEGVEKIEVAGPGFINFYLSKSVITKEIAEILENTKERESQKVSNKNENTFYGSGNVEVINSTPKKIVFEYTDPNPFKVFHIGHLMANTVGESLARLAEAQGAEVKRFCYQGDVGRHVALTIWGLRFMPHGAAAMPAEEASLNEKVSFFGKAYALGATEYKRVEDESKKSGQTNEAGLANSPEFLKVDAEVQNINKKIYDRSDEEINKIYDAGKEWSLEHFEELYNILGTKFDRYFFESQVSDDGVKIVKENTAPEGKAIFEESNGAVIFPGEKYGLHTRVFITRQGLPSYEGKEIGLAPMKYTAFEYDLGITVTANEQDDYFKVVNKAIGMLFPEFGEKVQHISHGMLRLTSGKMSSRTGDVITGESLIEGMIAESLEKMKEREMSDEEKRKVAEMVGVAAIKYTVLRQTIGKNIIFDPEKSLSFEGDSGPYLQYSCVRARAVLAKAEKEGIVPSVIIDQVNSGEKSEGDADSKSNESENSEGENKGTEESTNLEKMLVRFPEVTERAWKELAPHHVATYLTELASTFNSFYASSQIVKVGDLMSAHKVALTKVFSIIMKNGLGLLGIQVPEKM